MKRWIYLCLLSFIAAFIFSGCTTQNANPNTTEITYAFPSAATRDPVIKAALAEFSRMHPDIKVTPLPIAGDYYSKLMVMIAGNTAPDVMWMGQSFGEFAQRNAFLDVSKEMQAETDSQKYFSKVIDWYRFDKKLYGFPYGIDCVLTFYNKDIFRKAGVPFPQNDWNLDRFLATAQRLQHSDVAQSIRGFYAIGGEGVFAGAFDAHILSPDLSHSTINSPQYIKALQFNYDLKNKYHVSPGPASGMVDKNQAFRLGTVAMVSGATWDIPVLQRDAKDIDWDVVLPPRGVKRAIWGSSSGICVYSRTAHPKQSIELLKYLVSPEMQLKICRLSGCIPTNRKVAQEWAQSIETPEHIENFIKAIPYLEPSPRAVALSEIKSKMQRATERVMMGRATAEDAMNDAAEQIDRVIKRQNRLLGKGE